MNIREFINLPLDEQSWILDAAGFDGSCLLPDSQEEFSAKTGIVFYNFDKYYLDTDSLNVFYLYLFRYPVTGSNLKYVRNEYADSWIQMPKPYKLEFEHTNEDDISDSDCFHFILSSEEMEINNIWNNVKCDISEFYAKNNDIRIGLKSTFKKLKKTYQNYRNIYRTYAKNLNWYDINRSMNPGLISEKDLLVATYVMQRRYPDSIITPEFIMTLYYVLTQEKQIAVDSERYLDAISAGSIGNPELIDGIKLSEFTKIYDDYMKDNPGEEYRKKVHLANEMYFKKKNEIRHQIMKELDVPEDVFNDNFKLCQGNVVVN